MLMTPFLSSSVGSSFAKEAASSPLEISRQVAWTRREFLRTAAGITLGGALLRFSPTARAQASPIKKRKVIVVTFGGGARDQETFAPEGQENIPRSEERRVGKECRSRWSP